MQTYVALMHWTDRGEETVKDTVNRSHQTRATFERVGGRVMHIWWTQGRWDALVVFEAPDDETAAAGLLQIDSRGAVHTETLRAFDEDEMQRIIARIG